MNDDDDEPVLPCVHLATASVPVPERGAQHRGGADAGAVRRVQHAQHHQPVPERADHHRAHGARPALLLLRRRRALRGRAEARHQRAPRRAAAAGHGGGRRRRGQLRRLRPALGPRGRGARRRLPVPGVRVANGSVNWHAAAVDWRLLTALLADACMCIPYAPIVGQDYASIFHDE